MTTLNPWPRSIKAQPKKPATYRISGENVTIAQIAERLGIGEESVRWRLHREKQLPGATTWERLAK